MAWYNRPEGFTVKSFDAAAPTITQSNAIRFTAVLTPVRKRFTAVLHTGACDWERDPDGYCGACDLFSSDDHCEHGFSVYDNCPFA